MLQKRAGEIHVGTSGWSYDDWKGRFYPEGVTAAGRLEFYARHFDTVEVNNSFYRLPSETMVKGWNRCLPQGFRLVVKGSRLITHMKRLRDCGQALAVFFERVGALAACEVVLWQLPPSFGFDPGRLEDFLALLPPTHRHALEFRHPSWWDERTADVLARHDAGFVAVSHPGLPGEIVPTAADFVYVRFHGTSAQPYEHRYTPRELRPWAARLAPHVAARRTVYVYFNNDRHAHAIGNAGTFRALMEAAAGQRST